MINISEINEKSLKYKVKWFLRTYVGTDLIKQSVKSYYPDHGYNSYDNSTKKVLSDLSKVS